MRLPRTKLALVWLGVLAALWVAEPSVASSKKKRKKRYLPPVTHPVLLWARTISKSEDMAERKKAAFKLSAYTQPISHEEVVKTLLTCSKDSDVEIKVFCTKALRKAGLRSHSERVRNELIQLYRKDESLRPTIIGTLVARQEADPEVHDLLLESVKEMKATEDLLDLLQYFEKFGSGSDGFVAALSSVYEKTESSKVKRAIVKAIGTRGRGQDSVIALLSQCSQSKDTPLALNCLASLQAQGPKDKRAVSAVESTVESDDPDVLDASFDLLGAMPESPNTKITSRLLALVEDLEDPQLLEKAVLALGIVGTHTEEVVAALQKALEHKDSDEPVRVAAALVLGKQTELFPEKSKEILSTCLKSGTQSLKTACDLGLKEMQSRAVATKK